MSSAGNLPTEVEQFLFQLLDPFELRFGLGESCIEVCVRNKPNPG
jgi:hypothetical protein